MVTFMAFFYSVRKTVLFAKYARVFAITINSIIGEGFF